ncbi:hypothetical protein N7492_004407 [Penicillium capsulatum]|uniref:Uncharacterized protein n=1 Tax=Penicillium capsulatum TaxID=69766 RepID=A0A9W9I9T4_9EURO|nr:hypothetical protein N7492_004407 [Penicillium capsulatum]
MALLASSASAELENRNPDLLGNLAGGLVPGAQSSSTPASSTSTPPSGFKRVAAPTPNKRDVLSDPLQQLNDGTSEGVLKRNPNLLDGLTGGLMPGSQNSGAASSSPTPTPTPSSAETPYNPILKRAAATPAPENGPLNLARRDPQLGGGGGGGGAGGLGGGALGPVGGLLGQQGGAGASSSAAPSSATPTSSPTPAGGDQDETPEGDDDSDSDDDSDDNDDDDDDFFWKPEDSQ